MGPILEYACRERGVHLQCIKKSTFRILPPLTITYEQIDYFIAVLDEAMKDTLAGEYSINDILPDNPYTREFKMKGRKNLKTAIEKIWETSPKYWVAKIGEMVK